MKTILRSLLNLRSDFDLIFFKNEFTALSGKHLRTIIWLTIILLLTFLALGFAIGSIENLRKKMDNPFTNWVDIPVDRETSKKLDNIISRYEDPDVAQQYNLKGMVSFGRKATNFYHYTYNPFKHPKDSLQLVAFGRTVEEDEAILNRILDRTTNNVVWLAPEFESQEDRVFTGCEIIISVALMEAMGYEDASKIGYIIIEDDAQYYLKVVAVLKELPGRNDYILSPILYNMQQAEEDCRQNLLNENEEDRNQFIFLLDDKEKLETLQDQAIQFFDVPSLSVDVVETYQHLDEVNYLCKLYLLPTLAPTLDSFNLFVETYKDDLGIQIVAYIDCGNEVCEEIGQDGIDYLAFHFDELIKIRDFKKDVFDNFAVELDMNKVESKENFALVSRLTQTIAVMLLIFSILSIVLFVNNLLQTHLQKVKPNLGTFQAFGLSNTFLIGAYSKIIFSFLLIAVAIAFGISALIDVVEFSILEKNSHFNIFSPLILLAVVGIMIISVLLSSLTIKRILNDTPGNLIYGR